MPIGPLMIDLESHQLSNQERQLLKNPLIGGVILFARNFKDFEQLQHLVLSIRGCRSEPLLLTVDQEGGRVQRFAAPFTILPANRKLGQYFDTNPDAGLKAATEMGWLMASEILAAGIDFSFAPVLDVDDGNSNVIAERGFHNDLQAIHLLGQAYVDGMHQAGMIATAKHFPGHGSVIADSHLELPKDTRKQQIIFDKDLYPFVRLNSKLDAIMTAHVIYSDVDSEPATFSKVWLKDILRHRLGFKGVIFSDDLSMNACDCIGDLIKRAEVAIDAGCDMLLCCNDRDGVLKLINHLERHHSNWNARVSAPRLLKLCGRFNYLFEQLETLPRWHSAKDTAQALVEFSSEVTL